MTMFIYITIILLSLVVAMVLIVVFLELKKRRKHQERAQLQAASQAAMNLSEMQRWVAKIDAAQTDEEILATGDTSLSWHKYKNSGFSEAFQKFVDAETRARRASQVCEFKNLYQAAQNVYEKVELCVRIYHEALSEDVIGVPKDEVGAHICDLILQELADARKNLDSQALLCFLAMSVKYSRPRNWVLSEEQQASLELPDDWDDLVVELLENPSIYDFGLRADIEPGSVRMMAAEALRTRSLKLGKLVLAYCSIREDVYGDSNRHAGRSRQIVWPYRGEIGDVLLAEVTKMVHSIHVERNMFQAIR